jgi:hypothetical protein
MNDQNTTKETASTPWLAKMLSCLIDPEAPQNTNEEITPDKIAGLPAWHLEGINLDNLDTVYRTNSWIHYSDHADDGWGLVAIEKQIDSWRPHLAKAGITITPWETLPYKPYTAKQIIIGFLFCVVTFPLFPLIFITIPSAIIIAGRNSYKCRHLRSASGLRALLNTTNLQDRGVVTHSGRYEP